MCPTCKYFAQGWCNLFGKEKEDANCSQYRQGNPDTPTRREVDPHRNENGDWGFHLPSGQSPSEILLSNDSQPQEPSGNEEGRQGLQDLDGWKALKETQVIQKETRRMVEKAENEQRLNNNLVDFGRYSQS